MARDWAKVAAEVVELVGGQENIESVTHCVTRLRFQLKDESVANDDAIGALDGVIQVMHANGQYQVVIGSQVEAAYDAVLALLPSKGAGSVPEDDADAANKSIKDKLMDIISGVFLPMIGAMSAAGLIKALAVTLSTFGLVDPSSTTYTVLNCMAMASSSSCPCSSAIRQPRSLAPRPSSAWPWEPSSAPPRWWPCRATLTPPQPRLPPIRSWRRSSASR